jgi:sugar transferase (PEP-CTERM system associated)
MTEVVILVSSVYIGALLVFGNIEACQQAIGPLAPKAATVAGVNLTSLIAMGLYHFHQRLYFHEMLARILVGLGLGCIALAIAFSFFPQLRISPEVAGVSAVYALVLLISLRYYFVCTVDKNAFRHRTLVYGAGVRAQSILDIRRRADRRGFKIVGQIAAIGDDPEESYDLLDMQDESIRDVALSLKADEIVVAMDDRRGKLPVRQLLDAKLEGIRIIDLLEFLERETGKIRTDLVSSGWLIFSSGFRKSLVGRIAKRTIDLVVSSAIFLLTWPIMLLTILAIKIEDSVRAPIFYRQVRVGMVGETFQVLKFRSMGTDAEADGKAVWAEKNDSRVTRVGGFLRSSRLDELPQILNIFKGEMSLVGPRPDRPEFVDKLKKEIPYYAERHVVKPGLTGWAQLRYSYGASQDDAIEKLQYDLYYVKNQSAQPDVMILLQTVEVVLWSKGAR